MNDIQRTVLLALSLGKLDKKARFARDRAARGWGLAYQASSIDLPHQSHTLEPALKAPRASRIAKIQLELRMHTKVGRKYHVFYFVRYHIELYKRHCCIRMPAFKSTHL